MAWLARAPGKLVVLGEYAVLDGAPALVMAVDRYCRAAIDVSDDARCHLQIRLGHAENFDFAANDAAPADLVELLRRRLPAGPGTPPWRGGIDSAAFFDAGTKLGLGSSAAALCAWAGAWSGYLGRGGGRAGLTVEQLIGLHREFQDGAGSGLDVAASFMGGVLSFRLDSENQAHIGSVQLPNGVRFAGVFTGVSASTPDLVARYRAWVAARPVEAAERLRWMGDIAAVGYAASVADDGDVFLRAVADYGRSLGELGRAMRAEVVTADHRRILAVAKRFGVVYKVSGAGGGDLGLALTNEPDALDAFKAAVAELGFKIMDLALDRSGLVVEEGS